MAKQGMKEDCNCFHYLGLCFGAFPLGNISHVQWGK